MSICRKNTITPSRGDQRPDQQLKEQGDHDGNASQSARRRHARRDRLLQGNARQVFKPGTALNLPVYLDAEVQAYLSARAKARGVEVGQLVNELLKKDIELIEAAR